MVHKFSQSLIEKHAQLMKLMKSSFQNVLLQVIEAVYEDLKLKRDIFERLDKLCKPETILCTNTSTLDIDKVSCFFFCFNLFTNNSMFGEKQE